MSFAKACGLDVFVASVEDGTARLKISRPEKLNAFSGDAWPELRNLLGELESNEEVRSVILSGEGRCFSVGGDIDDMNGLEDLGSRRRFLDGAVAAVRALEEFPKPVIAAVHGPCFGGGLELTLVCDVVVCDSTASFGVPESRVGLVPGILLARGSSILNAHWLKYMAMTGDPIGPEDARNAGLVNFVVPEGEHLARSLEIASRLNQRAPLSLSLIKKAAAGDSGEYGRGPVEWGAMLQGSEDFAEGVAAFRERRTPEFRNR